jgi:hypothetical protein
MRNTAICISVATIAALLIFLSNGTSAQNTGAIPQQTRWDYKVIYINKLVGEAANLDGIVSGFENGLKKLGDDGWELCLEVNGGVVLKRPRLDR